MIYFEDNILKLKTLEGAKKALLVSDRAWWMQKSQSTFLEPGDGNTNFFQNFTNMSESVITIWDVQTLDGSRVTGFKEIRNVEVSQYMNLFKKPQREYRKNHILSSFFSSICL